MVPQHRRPVAGWLLLFCLLAPVISTFTYLHLQKYRITEKVSRLLVSKLDREDLILFKFEASEIESEINWENETEFAYDGQWYDVMEAALVGDTMYYWCWWDCEETELNKRIRDLVAQVLHQDPQRKQNQEHAFNFFKSLYCNGYGNFSVLLKATPYRNPDSFAFVSKVFYPPPFPPPRMA